MLIFIDFRTPSPAIKALEKMGEVVLFKTEGICYDAIAGHPDVFIFQGANEAIVAPNIPEKYKNILSDSGILFTEGKIPVGEKYPLTASYNALYTPLGLLHNTKVTDIVIKQSYSKSIHCNQAYTRCSTMFFDDRFITSDQGISDLLTNLGHKNILVDPQKIVIQGFRHGFFGGCCGIWQKKIFFCGELSTFDQCDIIRSFAQSCGYEFIELCGGVPYDIGGILFFDP